MLHALLAAASLVAGPPLRPTGTASAAGFSYVWYQPSHGNGPFPVVLALHGCLTNPASFEAGTRFFEDAEAHGYVVVMPAHSSSAENPNGCWAYWNNHYRGKGESAALVALIGDVAKRVAIDEKRVYAAGISSGGAMVAALAADYPDVFAAVAIGSSPEYQPCRSDDILRCYYALGERGQNQDPVASGKAAYAQGAAAHVARAVPAILLHGDHDAVVPPFNLELALTSIAVMNDGFLSGGTFPGTFTATPASHDAQQPAVGRAYDHYAADDGRLDWTIVHGMGHAWSGGVADRASNAEDGHSYNDPTGPDETTLFRAFLLRWSL